MCLACLCTHTNPYAWTYYTLIHTYVHTNHVNQCSCLLCTQACVHVYVHEYTVHVLLWVCNESYIVHMCSYVCTCVDVCAHVTILNTTINTTMS